MTKCAYHRAGIMPTLWWFIIDFKCYIIWRKDYLNFVSLTQLVQGSLRVCAPPIERRRYNKTISHWLGADTEWFLLIVPWYMHWDGRKLSLISFGSVSGLVPPVGDQLLEPILTRVSMPPPDVTRPAMSCISTTLISSCLYDLTHWLG